MNRIQKLSTHDIIRWLIYSLVILVPMIYHTGFMSAFTTPKLTLVRVVTILIVLVWGVQILAQKKLQYRSSPLNKWIVMYGVVLGITTLFSSYIGISFFGDQGKFLGLMTMLNFLFLFVVVMNFFQTKKDVYRFIKISVWTAMVLAIFGLLQFKGWVGAENWDYDPTLRVFGTMGHSNHFGAYLAFHVMLMAGMFINTKRPSTRAIYAIATLPMLATILATASRGAFFALVGAGVIFGAGWLYHKRSWIWEKRKKMGAGLVALLIIFAIFNKPIVRQFTNLSLTQRTISTIDFMMQGNVPDRVSWWYSSLAMTRDNPILGHGLATFRDTYNPYRRLDYRVPEDVQDTVTPETAHMEYLNIAATQGIVGLIVYLGLILCWARVLLRVMRNREDPSLVKKFTALSFISAGLVYFIQVLMSFGVVGTLVPLYLMMGASVAYYHITTDPKAQSQQFKSVEVRGATAAAGAFIVMLMVLFCSWFTVRQAAAEWHFKSAQKLYNQGEVAKMIEAYEKATKNIPWTYQYWEQFGENTFDFATVSTDMEIIDYMLQTSIHAYEKAYAIVQTQPYIQANLGLANLVYAEVLDAQGKTSEASQSREQGEDMYREAVTIGVNNPVYAYNLGQLMMGLDREEEAREAYTFILTFREPYKDIYYQLALIATNEADYETARTWIQKALDQDPSDENVKALLNRINGESEEEI